MNELAAARRRLYDCLAGVLPGRVKAYPSTVNAAVAPLVWFDTPTLQTERVGSSTTLWLRVFPVHIVVDGATSAQIDELEAIEAAIIDACERTAMVTARRIDRGDVALDANRVLRGSVVEVAVTITARVLCPPAEVAAVPIPPESVPVPA